jgi:hypothetical protein
MTLDIGYRYELPAASNALNGPGSPAQQNNTAVSLAIDGCTKALDYYETGATGVSTLSLLIALVGAAAGGIAVPALTAAANANRAQIAAWGGVSGVANSAQLGFVQVPAQSLQIRESIRTEYIKALQEYGAAQGNVVAERVAIYHMISACTAYSVHAVREEVPCGGTATLDASGNASLQNSCILGTKTITCTDQTTPANKPTCSPNPGQLTIKGGTTNGHVQCVQQS